MSRVSLTVLLLSISLYQTTVMAQSKGSLENPANQSIMSGIYLFSGWVCEANLVEIVIDGGSGLETAYGTSREDTRSACGDSDNGFALLYNMALLGTGEHEAVLFADGQEVDRSTFEVTRLSAGEFLRDKSKLAIAYNFPDYGSELWLEWNQSAQNFLISKEQVTPDPLDVTGIWYARATGTIVSVATERYYADRQELYAVTTNVDPFSDLLGGVHAGYIVGNTAQMSSILPEDIISDFTVTFTSTTAATLRVNSCRSTSPSIYCVFGAGDSLTLEKLAGNTDTRLYETAPVDELE